MTEDIELKAEVAALKKDGRLLIAAIAGYIAGAVGVAAAIIAALVAAILRMAIRIGISAFCQKARVSISK